MSVLALSSVYGQVCDEGQFRISLPERAVELCDNGNWEEGESFDTWLEYVQSVPIPVIEEPELIIEEQVEKPQIELSKSEKEQEQANNQPSFFQRMATRISNFFSSSEEKTQNEPEENLQVQPPIEPELVIEDTQANDPPEVKTEKPIEEESPVEELVEQEESEQSLPSQLTLACDESKLASDVNNCGVCGNVCIPKAAARVSCVVGTCAYTCDEGYIDADGDEDNGCECAPDQFEPNNNIETSFDLGVLQQGGRASLSLTTPNGDADYFHFHAVHDGISDFKITATVGSTEQQIQLCLYKEGQVISCQRGRVNFEEHTGILSGEGNYMISVVATEEFACDEVEITILNS